VKSRRVAGVAVFAVILVLVVVAIVAGGQDDHAGTRTGAGGSKGALAPPATVERTTSTAPTTEAVPLTTTTMTTTTTTAPKPVAIATPPCAAYQGSAPYFVVCGPTSLKARDRAAFDLVARGHVRDDCGSPTVDWGDGSGNVVCAIACESYPADERSIERKLEHTYADPGAYTVRFVLQGCGPDYRPQAEITMEVQVQ
jgi:hypothetical protein